MKRILMPIFLIFCFSCSTHLERKLADESKKEIDWQVNPCFDQPGKPFKKYYSFALDLEQNKILTKKSASAPIEIRQEKAKDGSPWKNTEQFFIETGIQKACGGPLKIDYSHSEADDGTETEPGSNQGPSIPQMPFTPPIQFNLKFYYSLIEKSLEDKSATSNFRELLEKFLNRPHSQSINRPDQLVDSCIGFEAEEGLNCISPKTYSYNEARAKMFGGLDLKKNDDNSYSVFDYYCQKWMSPLDFKDITQEENELPGPLHIVNSKKMNVEHSWPQSKFMGAKGSFLNLVQKTDFHHIFPTNSEVNRLRGNFEFANVEKEKAQEMKCGDGRLGPALSVEGARKAQGLYFEPPKNHKGNIARALFYFSTRYNGGMSSLQEYYLRKWNDEDPVDNREKERNENIYKLTGVRNPFVDHPEWASFIHRFCRVRTENDQSNGNENIDCI